ncbi:MAG TPA: HEAT repeat domain-containing protein [Gemmataceae bacterium]|nr:HEAT repeat domain-containing protein [Gemmataceae bacterium]
MNFVMVCPNCQSKVAATETEEGQQFFCPVCNAFIHGLDFSQYLKDLATGDYVTRHIAAEKFAYLDPSCASLVVEPLTKALKDPSFRVRSSAAYSLCRLQPNEKGPLQMLVEYAASSEPEIRQDCSRLLGDLKVQDEGAVRVLMNNVANDPEPEVRKQSAFSLGQMVPASAPAVPVLAKALKDSNWDVQKEAANSLRFFGPTAKAAISGLEECISEQINNPFQEVRELAILALGEIAPESWMFLLHLLKDRHGGVRYEAARGLRKMGTHVLPGLEELIESLKDDYAVEEIIGCLEPVIDLSSGFSRVFVARSVFPAVRRSKTAGFSAKKSITGSRQLGKSCGTGSTRN